MFDLRFYDEHPDQIPKGLFKVLVGGTREPIPAHAVYEPFSKWEYATMRFNQAFTERRDEIEIGVTRVSLIAK